MIQAAHTSRNWLSPVRRATAPYARVEPKCFCCGQCLALYPAPVRIPPGYRLEHTHAESGERNLAQFGVCNPCCLVFDDLNALMVMYEQVRQDVLIAVHHARLARGLFEGGHHDVPAALSELASGFPCLRGQPGARPFSAAELQEWVCEAALSASERDCAGFVLHVADARSSWARHFDAVAAMQRWEPAERAVFIEWAKAPWWA